MQEFCQHLRSKLQPVTCAEQTRQQSAGSGVVRVFDNFDRDEKAGVNPVNHARSFNI